MATVLGDVSCAGVGRGASHLLLPQIRVGLGIFGGRVGF